MHLKTVITKSDEDEFVKVLLETIVKTRVEKEELDAKVRYEKVAAEIRQLEAQNCKAEIEFELEKLRYSTVEKTGNSEKRNKKIQLDLQKLVQKVDPNLIDISLYLIMFEKQAKRARTEKYEWVSHLMTLLPIDIIQIIMREPEEQNEDYNFIKKPLL